MYVYKVDSPRSSLDLLADDAREKEMVFRSKRHARQSSLASEPGSKTAPNFFARHKLMARHICSKDWYTFEFCVENCTSCFRYLPLDLYFWLLPKIVFKTFSTSQKNTRESAVSVRASSKHVEARESKGLLVLVDSELIDTSW